MDNPTKEERVLRIKSRDWNDVEFFKSSEDQELNIEVLIDGRESNYTWLTVEEAKRLRDFLNRMYP